MPRRRIAIVSPFIDKRHGTERRVAELISRLSNDYEIHLYSTRVEDIDLSRVVWHRVPRLPGPQLIAYLWWFFANHIWRWRDRGRRVVPDLVYSPGINCLDADVVSVHIVFRSFRKRMHDALRFTRNPMIAWPRILHRRLYYGLIAVLESAVYERADVALAAVSMKIAADLRRCYPASGEIRVIYNGLDLERFSPHRRAMLRDCSRSALSFGNDDFVLLLIGNDWRNKGLHVLIDSIAELADSRLHALVVGNDDRSAFIPRINKLGLQIRIHFCPPRADVETYYAAADAYVGPSIDDAFAQPPAEAMACGLPVITSRTNGASEIITHGCDGLVMEDPADSKTLAAMIQSLLSESALRCRLGRNAATTAHRHTWDQNAAQMRDIFDMASHRSAER